MNLDYSSYLSPFSWRYGGTEMRQIWSEENKRLLWRKCWVALAEVQAKFGLVSSEQAADLRAHMLEIDIPRSLEIEAEIHHDLMAELKCFAEQAAQGGAILHLGATSMDIEDNAEVLRMRFSIDKLMSQLDTLLMAFAEQIEATSDFPIIAFTHLQPAEPSTLGYRLAMYAQDLLTDREQLSRVRRDLKGKGFRGAVGTSASYAELFGSTERLAEFDTRLSTHLSLPFYTVTSQVYPRKQDYQVVSALAGLGASLYKFAFDLRILQSPSVGEMAEPFGIKQVGSSAMPFKRNPIHAEKIDSLARQLAGLPRLAWDNAAHSLLERTLDDSANRRSMLPEAFLIVDELLSTAQRLVSNIVIDRDAIARNLERYGPFAASERVLMAASKNGADRQVMHERLRRCALDAWKAVRAGEENPLALLISGDEVVRQYLTAEQIRNLMDASAYIGDAPDRARELARRVRSALE